ncbi:MAG: hypothetical protein Q8P59_01705 [Dehalococcoidia bacterium]|nr:hypothetical protein [Dehalococcoidia bacterium]
MEEIEHEELECPKIFDVVTFLVQFGHLKRVYPDEKTFREDIQGTIQSYLDKNGLQESVRLLSASQDKEGIAPAAIFGAEFWPDMVLEQDGEIVAAILVKLVKANPSGLTEAAGRALICSHRYPWVLSLVLDRGKRLRDRRALDHEFRAHMWHSHHVRFLFR